ncbi:hypothetical protein D3C80_1534920 [compost metagenome]
MVAIRPVAAMTASALRTTSVLIVRFSDTVSTSRSAPVALSVRLSDVANRASAAVADASSVFPSRTPSARMPATVFSALANCSDDTSTSRTSCPAEANAWAMPTPMRPAPTTATLAINLYLLF